LLTLSVGSSVTWDPQDFSPAVWRQAGVGTPSALVLLLLAGLVWKRGFRCLPLLYFLSAFPQALDAVSSFKHRPSKHSEVQQHFTSLQITRHSPVSRWLQLWSIHTRTHAWCRTVLLILLSLRRNGRAPEPAWTRGDPSPSGATDKAQKVCSACSSSLYLWSVQ